MNIETDKNFAERLKQIRLNNGLTQKQMAERLGVNERTYQRHEAGTSGFSFKSMQAFITCFGALALKFVLDIPDETWSIIEQDVKDNIGVSIDEAESLLKSNSNNITGRTDNPERC